VLTSGPLNADPQELLLSDRLEGALAVMKEDYEIVLIDSAPVLSVADSGLLAGRVDGVIVVVRSGVATTAEMRLVRERLTTAGGSIVGCVLNQFTGPAGQDYHPYGYAYSR
jgi:Mrp family chromosome partitioning ATPase